MNGILVFMNVAVEGSPALPPHEDTAKRWPCVNQEAGSHQTPDLLAP